MENTSFYETSKWNRDKVEGLMTKNNFHFTSNDRGYYDAYVDAYGQKRRITVNVMKSSITIRIPMQSYCKGIKSYAKLDYWFKYFHDEVKDTVWNKISLAEKMTYRIVEEYKEEGTTNILEGFVGAVSSNINRNMSSLCETVNNQSY